MTQDVIVCRRSLDKALAKIRIKKHQETLETMALAQVFGWESPSCDSVTLPVERGSFESLKKGETK